MSVLALHKNDGPGHYDKEKTTREYSQSGGEMTWTNTGATRSGRGQHKTG